MANRVPGAALLAGGVLFAWSGCATVIGLDHDYVSEDALAQGGGGAASASSASASSGGAECPMGFECVPAVLAGTYARIAPIANVDACPTGWAQAGQLNDGVDPGCTSCSCDAPIGGACSPGAVHRWAQMTCAGMTDSVTPTNGQCVDLVSGGSGFSVESPIPSQGSCTASMSTALPMQEQTLCTFNAAAALRCGEDHRCVPSGNANFGGVCNLLPGGSVCASGWVDKGVVYGGFTDSRVCSCACGLAAGAMCSGGNIALYSTDDCSTGLLVAIIAGSGCTDTSLLDTNTAYKAAGGTWAAGACPPQSLAQGAVTPSDPFVLCCGS